MPSVLDSRPRAVLFEGEHDIAMQAAVEYGNSWHMWTVHSMRAPMEEFREHMRWFDLSPPKVLLVCLQDRAEHIQNALLKTLEELGSRVLILVMPLGLALPTVRSRCTSVAVMSPPMEPDGGDVAAVSAVARAMVTSDLRAAHHAHAEWDVTKQFLLLSWAAACAAGSGVSWLEWTLPRTRAIQLYRSLIEYRDVRPRLALSQVLGEMCDA